MDSCLQSYELIFIRQRKSYLFQLFRQPVGVSLDSWVSIIGYFAIYPWILCCFLLDTFSVRYSSSLI